MSNLPRNRHLIQMGFTARLHIFAFYALCMVGQLIWVITVMPETMGVALEEMEKNLGMT